jgi:hypothetical protein
MPASAPRPIRLICRTIVQPVGPQSLLADWLDELIAIVELVPQ